MPREFTATDEMMGARFTMADLRDLRIRQCDLRGLDVTDSYLADLRLDGFVRNLRVNDVDVTEFVAAELDRRRPERVQLRAATTPDDYRALWPVIEQSWADAVARARTLPADTVDARVGDEWSLADTLRHLIFATDAWLRRAVLDEERPYTPIGRAQTDYGVEQERALGIDPDLTPSFDEVLATRAERQALVRSILDGLTTEQLDETCPSTPAPGYDEDSPTVRQAIRVVMNEEIEHLRYALRDLDRIDG